MSATRKQNVLFTTVALLFLLLVVSAGSVTAQEDITFEQNFKNENVLATNEQTIQFNVTNNLETPLEQPIIEIVDSSQIEIDETRDATIIRSDGTETTTSMDRLTSSESVSGEEAVIIEGAEGDDSGEGIAPDTTNTFEINVSVQSAGDLTVETLVYPLFDRPSDIEEVESRDNSDIDTLQEEAFQPGTLDVNVVNDNSASISVDDEVVGTGDYNTEVAAEDIDGESIEYDVSAESPFVNEENITLDKITVQPIDPTKSVRFSDVEEAPEPKIIGQATAQTATPEIAASDDSLQQGTATDSFKQEFSFDLITDGGTFVIGVDDPSDLNPSQEVNADTDSGSVSIDDFPETATLANLSTNDDATVSITYTGYPLGDAQTTGETTNEDAVTIAQSVASGEESTLPQLYADVTEDDEITAADAMFIAQYDEGNGERGADYNLNGGS